ncbi:hypothetical protein KRR26_35855 [Corallococcus sp. M34]|uniref:hypothetical protein n=1 Tax=Citreicoccus inhibens TaxID=2849499 RepID=UPI001C23A013|nr:hypothetical protein [Citreicoccus inhibens]MBU8900984.1 hypothetical protein [Citreicoccus inhibens]
MFYMQPLRNADFLPDARKSMGFDRIGMLSFEAPASSFILGIAAYAFGEFRLAAASIKNRLTVIGLVVRPDGSFDLSQNLLRVPGERYDKEPAPELRHARLVRQLQLGQKLYASGELWDAMRSAPGIYDLFRAKWTDPILGCMGYLAGDPRARLDPPLTTLAQNLGGYFSELPDAQLIQALHNGHFDPKQWGRQREHSSIPVLAESLRELVRLGDAATPLFAELGEISRRIMPNQPWTCIWR